MKTVTIETPPDARTPRMLTKVWTRMLTKANGTMKALVCSRGSSHETAVAVAMPSAPTDTHALHQKANVTR